MFRRTPRKPADAPADRFRLVGVDLTATRLRAVSVGTGHLRPLVLDEPNEELPLFVTLDRREADLGHAGLAVCRLTPHAVCSNFLPLLRTPHEWRGDRRSHTPESALAECLGRLQAPIAAETDAAGLTVPAYLSLQQVRTVLEKAAAARLPLRGSAVAPLAVVAHRVGSVGAGPKGAEPAVLVIDADEFALTAALVAVGTEDTRVIDKTAVPKASLRAWKDRLIDGLSDKCVRACRRDPRDSAVAEQDLYLQLGSLLETAKSGHSFTVSVRSDRWYQDLTVHPDDLEMMCAGVNRLAIDGLKEFLGNAPLDGPPRAVWLTATAGRLPGLAAKIVKHSPAETKVSLLPANAAAEAAAALVPRWLTGKLPRTHLDVVLPHAAPMAAGGPAASIGRANGNGHGPRALPRKAE